MQIFDSLIKFIMSLSVTDIIAYTISLLVMLIFFLVVRRNEKKMYNHYNSWIRAALAAHAESSIMQNSVILSVLYKQIKNRNGGDIPLVKEEFDKCIEKLEALIKNNPATTRVD